MCGPVHNTYGSCACEYSSHVTKLANTYTLRCCTYVHNKCTYIRNFTIGFSDYSLAHDDKDGDFLQFYEEVDNRQESMYV